MRIGGNEQGFTLIEMTVAFGLMAILSYFVATQMLYSGRINQTEHWNEEFSSEMATLTTLLNSRGCTNALKGAQFNPASNPIANWPSIKQTLPSGQTITLLTVSGPPGLAITSILVNKIILPLGGGTYIANLNVHAQIVDGQGNLLPGASNLSRDIPIYVEASGRTITQCCTAFDPACGGGGPPVQSCAQLASLAGDTNPTCESPCSAPETDNLGSASDCTGGNMCCAQPATSWTCQPSGAFIASVGLPCPGCQVNCSAVPTGPGHTCTNTPDACGCAVCTAP